MVGGLLMAKDPYPVPFLLAQPALAPPEGSRFNVLKVEELVVLELEIKKLEGC